MRGVWTTAAAKLMARDMEVAYFPPTNYKISADSVADEVCHGHSTDISSLSVTGGSHSCDSCGQYVKEIKKCGAIACEMVYCNDCQIAVRSSALLCFYCKDCRSHIHGWFQGNELKRVYKIY